MTCNPSKFVAPPLPYGDCKDWEPKRHKRMAVHLPLLLHCPYGASRCGSLHGLQAGDSSRAVTQKCVLPHTPCTSHNSITTRSWPSDIMAGCHIRPNAMGSARCATHTECQGVEGVQSITECRRVCRVCCCMQAVMHGRMA